MPLSGNCKAILSKSQSKAWLKSHGLPVYPWRTPNTLACSVHRESGRLSVGVTSDTLASSGILLNCALE
eukprot:5102726-Amphidinium_carterae.1